MTTQRKIEIAGFIFVLLVLGCFARGWILERDARNQAEATAAAQTQIIAHDAAAIVSRDAAAQVYAKSLTDQAAAIRTPQQAAQTISRYLPTLESPAGAPAPAQAPAIIQKTDLSAAEQAKLPDSPTYMVLTPAQAESVASLELTCDAATHTLTACQADKLDQAAQLAAALKESAAWEVAAKGGTKWHRFLTVAKFAGCAAGGALIGHLADKQSPTVGSAIGGAAAVGACSLF
jgi:hypothetical protein